MSAAARVDTHTAQRGSAVAFVPLLPSSLCLCCFSRWRAISCPSNVLACLDSVDSITQHAADTPTGDWASRSPTPVADGGHTRSAHCAPPPCDCDPCCAIWFGMRCVAALSSLAQPPCWLDAAAAAAAEDSDTDSPTLTATHSGAVERTGRRGEKGGQDRDGGREGARRTHGAHTMHTAGGRGATVGTNWAAAEPFRQSALCEAADAATSAATRHHSGTQRGSTRGAAAAAGERADGNGR